MLKLENIHKTYKSKKTQEFEALKGINLEFGSKGFIVLLGKSGSGKSTLLNVIGGLDNFNEGKITIKDKSTEDFNRNEWDSYRNTYVGFVFQEFYIIEEFSVGKNIALALELQDYPKDKIERRVSEILNQVDLAGYKDRRPNEVSGGQKQRIAIARALIKDPQIILADEPTGNLDSETGRMILETLKELSKTKLVIMVTHDSDFAHEFGDRIIELKDGKVMRDELNPHVMHKEMIYRVSDKMDAIIKLPKGRKLSKQMIDYINEQLMKCDDNLYLGLSDDTDYVRTFVPDIDKKETTSDTEELERFLTEEKDEKFSLRKTLLPFGYALKLAVSSLFTKKVRLIFMTMLFIVSLIFVGIATGFSFYDNVKASSLTFEKAGINTLPLEKYQEFCETDFCYSRVVSVPDEDINYFKTTYSNITFLESYNIDVSLYELIGMNSKNQQGMYYSDRFNKLMILNDEQTHFQLLEGTTPQNNREIMITDYMAEMILEYEVYQNVNEIDDVIGKEMSYNNYDLTISGIIKTDYLNYQLFKEEKYFDDYEFYTKKEQTYQQMFMSSQTYEEVFKHALIPINIVIENYDTSTGYQVISSYVDERHRHKLVGAFPQARDEIVLSLSSLNQYLKTDLTTDEEILEYIDDKSISFSFYNMKDYESREYKIVGVIKDEYNFDAMFHNDELDEISSFDYYKSVTRQLTAIIDGGSTEFLRDLNDLNYRHDTEYSRMLYTIEEVTKGVRTVFYIIGGVFAAFTAFLIFTFISSSIANKKKEIGTLRAIGARGIDVGKIFMTEGLIIALFASIVANIFVTIIINLFNRFLTDEFQVDIVLLYTNIYSLLSVFLLSIIVIVIATYIPIKRITLMKPIKAIKDIK